MLIFNHTTATREIMANRRLKLKNVGDVWKLLGIALFSASNKGGVSRLSITDSFERILKAIHATKYNMNATSQQDLCNLPPNWPVYPENDAIRFQIKEFEDTLKRFAIVLPDIFYEEEEDE